MLTVVCHVTDRADGALILRTIAAWLDLPDFQNQKYQTIFDRSGEDVGRWRWTKTEEEGTP